MHKTCSTDTAWWRATLDTGDGFGSSMTTTDFPPFHFPLHILALRPKAMILAFKEKAPDTDVIPAPLEHRFGNLLKAVDDTLVCGRVRSFIPGAGAPDRGNTDRTNSMKDGNAEGRLEPTVANIDAIEGFFDTRSGVSVQNAGLLQFVRSAIYSLR